MSRNKYKDASDLAYGLWRQWRAYAAGLSWKIDVVIEECKRIRALRVNHRADVTLDSLATARITRRHQGASDLARLHTFHQQPVQHISPTTPDSTMRECEELSAPAETLPWPRQRRAHQSAAQERQLDSSDTEYLAVSTPQQTSEALSWEKRVGPEHTPICEYRFSVARHLTNTQKQRLAETLAADYNAVYQWVCLEFNDYLATPT